MAIDIDNLYSHNLADKSIDEIDRWLRQTYGMAWNELSKTIDEYVARVEKQDAEKRKQVENGTLSVDEYKQWRIRRANDDKRWETLKKSIAQKITQTNIIASDYINSKTPEVYASAHNFMNYEYEQNTGISFTVVNKDAIKAMALGKNVTQFKTLKVNAKRDYKWNQDRIQKALMSGIVQGKSMPKIANDFYQIMGSNKKSALRNARTAVTSAQNCGYNDSMVELLKMGIKFHKKWVSSHDNRVRDSHAQLDGVLIEPDEKFPNGLLYPADPQGEPSEVYNCRCRMTASLDDYREDEREIREYYIDEKGKRRSRVVKVKADKHTKETYNQWLKRKSDNKKFKLNQQLFALKVPDKKIKGYCLNPNHPEKYVGFKKVLGFDTEDWEVLQQKFIEAYDPKELIKTKESKYGISYEQHVKIEGKNGNVAPVEIIWMNDGTDTNFITAYVKTRGWKK